MRTKSFARSGAGRVEQGLVRLACVVALIGLVLGAGATITAAAPSQSGPVVAQHDEITVS